MTQLALQEHIYLCWKLFRGGVLTPGFRKPLKGAGSVFVVFWEAWKKNPPRPGVLQFKTSQPPKIALLNLCCSLWFNEKEIHFLLIWTDFFLNIRLCFGPDFKLVFSFPRVNVKFLSLWKRWANIFLATGVSNPLQSKFQTLKIILVLIKEEKSFSKLLLQDQIMSCLVARAFVRGFTLVVKFWTFPSLRFEQFCDLKEAVSRML